MTQAADTRGLGEETGKSREARIIGLVSAAHFVSHVYIIILPPLFAFIRADYAASYAEIGFAVATFNIVSTVLQAPAGFLVDRIAPRNALILALVVGAAGLTLIGLLPFYWALVAGMAVAGVANTIYHPADYAILAHAVGAKRIGHAFSLHTFFGMLGTAATPVCMLFLAERFGWHGAILGAALIGFVMAAVLLLDRTMAGARQGRGAGRLAPAAVAGDPAKCRLLHPAVGRRRRHLELRHCRARRAARHADRRRQFRALGLSARQCARRAGGRAARGANRAA
jgi:MFS family permease